MRDVTVAVRQVTDTVSGAHDRATSRNRLINLWDAHEQLPLIRCVTAHYLADLMDDKADELAWDLRALEAGRVLRDVDVQAIDPSLTIGSFLSSLYLNLAADYFDLGRAVEAEVHLRLVESLLPYEALESPYAAMIRRGAARLRRGLVPIST
jgi:hypothetical protein